MEKKSSGFSIYLLKLGFEPENSLIEDHEMERVNTSHPYEGTEIYIQDKSILDPWWVAYWKIDKGNINEDKEESRRVMSGALIFWKSNDRYFVFSHGHAFHKLNNDSYENDFGLRVTLNAVDEQKLRMASTHSPGQRIQRTTKLLRSNNLAFFDLEEEQEVFNSLVGYVQDKYKKYFQHPAGSDSLHMQTKYSPKELNDLCSKLLDLYRDETYKKKFPFMHNFVKEKDRQTISKLNDLLVRAVKSRDEQVDLNFPDLWDNHWRNLKTRFKRSKKKYSSPYNDLSMENYYAYFGDQLEEMDNDILLDKSSMCWVDNDDNEIGKELKFRKCFIFDVRYEDERYYLYNGDWYKVEESYIKKLQEFLDKGDWIIPRDKEPKYSHENENAYNEDLATNYLDKSRCLDKKNIAPENLSQVEPCDVYSMLDEKRHRFYHIKIYRASDGLSHLFFQGENAYDLLSQVKESRDKFLKLEFIKDLLKEENMKSSEIDIGPSKCEVYYLIIFKKGIKQRKKLTDLPFFSQISIKKTLTNLKTKGVDVKVMFIESDDENSQDKVQK